MEGLMVQTITPDGSPDHKEPSSAPAKASELGAFSGGWSRALQDLLSAIFTLIKIVGLTGVLIWAFFHRDFIETWLWSVSGGEVAGLKFQREAIDAATAALEEYSSQVQSCQPTQDTYCFDKAVGEDAIKRASRVAPAIVDARILWVDPNPENAPIKKMLEKMGMQVTSKNTTEEALDILKVSPFDVIITNVSHPKDPEHRKRSLTVCRVLYFDFPNSPDMSWTKQYFSLEDQTKDPEQAKQLALARFDLDANIHSEAGFGLADQILYDWGTNDKAPQIIFYTNEFARVARPFCGYRITNRGDVLLNSIVSILEQRYAKRLDAKPWEKSSSAKD
jgi:CheY-like chemotaxis protein